MRLLRLVWLALMISATQLSMAQSQPSSEETGSPERDIAKSIHLFPNPATEFVHVKFDHVPAEKMRLTLHNLIGNEVQIETEIVDEFEIRVKVKDLAAGYYLLAVKDEAAKFRGTYKFLKR